MKFRFHRMDWGWVSWIVVLSLCIWMGRTYFPIKAPGIFFGIITLLSLFTVLALAVTEKKSGPKQ